MLEMFTADESWWEGRSHSHPSKAATGCIPALTLAAYAVQMLSSQGPLIFLPKSNTDASGLGVWGYLGVFWGVLGVGVIFSSLWACDIPKKHNKTDGAHGTREWA